MQTFMKINKQVEFKENKRLADDQEISRAMKLIQHTKSFLQREHVIPKIQKPQYNEQQLQQHFDALVDYANEKKHQQIDEDRMVSKTMKMIERVMYKKKYGFDDWEEDDGLPHIIEEEQGREEEVLLPH